MHCDWALYALKFLSSAAQATEQYPWVGALLTGDYDALSLQERLAVLGALQQVNGTRMLESQWHAQPELRCPDTHSTKAYLEP